MTFSEVDLELISRNELYTQKICKVLISTVICDASFKKMSNIGRAQRWVLMLSNQNSGPSNSLKLELED